VLLRESRTAYKLGISRNIALRKWRCLQAGPEHPGRALDVHTEKAGDHNDDHDYADDVENIH
jgi:hypothetical protein